MVHRCAWCRRILFNGSWVTVDPMLIEEVEDRVTDGICLTCRDTVYDARGTR